MSSKLKIDENKFEIPGSPPDNHLMDTGTRSRSGAEVLATDNSDQNLHLETREEMVSEVELTNQKN